MRVLQPILTLTVFILGTIPITAQENKKVETAWSKFGVIPISTSPYVFGSVRVPPDFIAVMSENYSNDDPFEEKKDTPELKARGEPTVAASNVPRCLKPDLGYLDYRKAFARNGIQTSDKEWIMLNTGLKAGHRLYFCLSKENASLLEEIMSPLTHGPSRMDMTTILVSIPTNGIGTEAWTYEKIIAKDPRFHSRAGISTRSSEKASNSVSSRSDSKKECHLTTELILGDDSRLYDCSLEYKYLSKKDPLLRVEQGANFVGKLGMPFVLPCGRHGKEPRDYFLIIQTTFKKIPRRLDSFTIHRHLPKIQGIYAVPSGRTKKTPPTKPAEEKNTHVFSRSYKAPTDFLHQLKKALTDSPGDNDDPFADQKEPVPPTAPLRVYKLPSGKPVAKEEVIFDITPQLLSFFPTKMGSSLVFYNANKHLCIIRGQKMHHDSYQSLLSLISKIDVPRMIRVTSTIVEVDVQPLKFQEWSPEIVQRSNPKIVSKYTTTSRSGVRSSAGKTLGTYQSTDSNNKKTTYKEYEYEIEPTIGEANYNIDMRIAIESEHRKRDPITFNLSTATTTLDGDTRIFELGHPASSTRTHLLILNTDIITPDGSFHRDLFKPIEDKQK